ncbi:hypothetical protein KO500_13685 [Cellulophaga baltica]|uniref:hypothetical protein n=1 Tax=Cellulophaga TaxID=104264 RepID=UPI001C07D740|nr:MULTISPECIES: hypothetical protein [Cellulophaga]MBU2997495.1 hypothetical protein [Cellulophaga baltica]MDO6768891.1 hypothetical protein [Cellulophaga sp. 1_MG-2023]
MPLLLEWAYTPKQISNEVSKIYDYYISLEDPSVESELKKEKLQGLEEQVEKMMFWEELKGKTYIPPEPENKKRKKQEPLNLEVFGILDSPYALTPANDQSLNEITVDPVQNDIHAPQPETTQTETLEVTDESTETTEIEEVKAPERLMPTANDVYHFHPIAFINQMKLMFPEGENEYYCDRDLSEEEVKKIIVALRKSESSVYVGSNKEKLFFKSNCDLPETDKTFAKFTKELNKAFNTYTIDTCIRSMHFLAQIYHETDRLRTNKEYATQKPYAPYTGRGLMQLTWKSNYIKYKDYSNVECVTDYESISNNLFNAFDFAAWFWEKGKALNVGTTWTAPSTAPSYVSVYNASYPKSIIIYDNEGNSDEYGTVDLNLMADNDHIDIISWFVNGGSNGLQERRDYLKKLKKIFKYDAKCVSNINRVEQEPESIVNNGVILHFTGETSTESSLSEKTKNILKEEGEASGNFNIHITSTARTPYDQARIMYENCKSTGASVQKGIYASSGDQVIDVYTAEDNLGKSKEEVIEKMEDKILEIGPSTVSKHLADPEVMNTFDVSYGNLTDKTNFWDEMEKRSELDKILEENSCYHIQINQ